MNGDFFKVREPEMMFDASSNSQHIKWQGPTQPTQPTHPESMRLQMAQDETSRLQSETRYDLFKRINKKIFFDD